MPVTDEEFEELLVSFGREAIHLETRDAYGTAVELPHMTQWAAWPGLRCPSASPGPQAPRSPAAT